MAVSARPAPFVRSFSFPDGEENINGGCAVVVGRASTVPHSPLCDSDDPEEFCWSDAQTAAFLAGEPLTLSWVSPSPAAVGRERAYVCCWITIEND